MTIISIRISEKEKLALRKHGKISSVIKEAIALYLDSEQSKRTFKRLKELQRASGIRTTATEDVSLIKEDRSR
ncbi:MAG: hypothetical protein ACREAY_00060 [Nitrososphaera sp.]|uniref:hypothetical protein n=1 Tax=Nitrososphaera sp. TaxID=1971748 RepID=UPI003D6F40A8